jgi:von Willebrand factor type A C-terminal domain/von Willebrand factor type A domain
MSDHDPTDRLVEPRTRSENDLHGASSAADQGTQLGAVTRFLTRALTVILLPLVALQRIARGIGRVLSFAATAVGAAVRRIARGALRLIRAIVSPFVEAARRFGLLLRRLGAWLAWRLDLLLRRLVAWLAWWLVPLARALKAVVRAILNRLAPLGHALAAAARYAAETVGRWVRRPAGRVVLVVLLISVALIVPRPLGGLLGLYLIFPLAGWYVLRAVWRVLAAPLRRVAAWVEHAGHRASHSIQVAQAKATFQATRSGSLRAPEASGDAVSSASPADPVPFHAMVYQNEHLPRDGVQVDAIITVTADDEVGPVGGTERRTPEAAEVIMLDCSGSMAYPLAKLREAQRATAAAIDSLRDGTWFALVRATQVAELAYPPSGGLAQASPATRKAAKRALNLLWAEGGTAMGQWLTLARDLLASRPSAIAHAILLTDGRNESETPAALASALAACSGRFQCDCRGVGTDWEVGELRTIASSLLGTVDIVAEPAGLETDFRSMMEAAMAKTVGGVALRVWAPKGATVRFLKQVSPAIVDVTALGRPVDSLTAEYPTGAWGEESRDYHLSVRVPRREIGEEMLAARVSMVVAGRVASQALVRAIWTDDEQLSTRINREVAHYTGQAELAEVIQEGLEARKSGDEETATFKLGRAVQLATASGNDGTMKLLCSVVDIEDLATGTVRLKRRVEDADEMALDTRSTKTVRVKL